MPVNLVPALIYDDAKRAIAFLTEAFGFEVKEAYEDGGVVHHAELTYGDGMVMLGNTRDNEHSRRVVTPERLGGVTSSIYVVVDDPDAHRARAQAAGAAVSELTDQDYGSRDYSAWDPEGYLWNFGTYQP
jgi:uncharacterized glyoxalase superfamily protein PhnB